MTSFTETFLFFFAVFVFNIKRKTTNDFKKELYRYGFFYERKEILIFFLFSQKKALGTKLKCYL